MKQQRAFYIDGFAMRDDNDVWFLPVQIDYSQVSESNDIDRTWSFGVLTNTNNPLVVNGETVFGIPINYDLWVKGNPFDENGGI